MPHLYGLPQRIKQHEEPPSGTLSDKRLCPHEKGSEGGNGVAAVSPAIPLLTAEGTGSGFHITSLSQVEQRITKG